MTDEQEKLRQLRERTGRPYQECRQALTDAAGDVDRAVDLILVSGETYTVEEKQALKTLIERLKKEHDGAADE